MLRFLGWHSVVILVVMVIPSNGTEDVRNSNITHAFNRANMMILLWLHCMVKLLFWMLPYLSFIKYLACRLQLQQRRYGELIRIWLKSGTLIKYKERKLKKLRRRSAHMCICLFSPSYFLWRDNLVTNDLNTGSWPSTRHTRFYRTQKNAAITMMDKGDPNRLVADSNSIIRGKAFILKRTYSG